MSATFHEAGYAHLVELVHQKDGGARRQLASRPADRLRRRRRLPRDHRRSTRARRSSISTRCSTSLPRRTAGCWWSSTRATTRPIFPYRPHHYGYLQRRDSPAPPLYYAVNATLGGVPDRIGAVALNNFETYLFLDRPLTERYALAVGNLSRFATAEAQVVSYYDGARLTEEVRLPPKAHAEIPLAPEHDGQRLRRVELKALFRLTSYVVGRRAREDALVLFDHLFTYFK